MSDGVRLDEAQRQALLAAARQALEAAIEQGQPFRPETDDPVLLEPRATFVTLRNRHTGELRGCRGEIRAVRPLIESVARQAVASATGDPRFPPVEADELPAIHIHISALTSLAPITPGQVELGRHGLLIESARRSGLLLPQVPEIYGLAAVDEFLEALCRKAGLAPGAWLGPGVRLQGFEAEHWGEPGDPTG